MKGVPCLDAVSIVLVKPRIPENLGAVARAMKNMGLSRLVVVNGVSPLEEDAIRLASGAEDLLERAEEAATLREAVAEMGLVVGMTSRGGRDRSPLVSPGEAVRRIVPVSRRNRVALVFGSEREGLTHEDLSLCQLYVRIPAAEGFSSLNLAQAVVVLCYELFKGSAPLSKEPPRLAPAEALDRMYERMEGALRRIEFTEGSNPARVLGALRKVFGRSRLTEREVGIFEGIWRQVGRVVPRGKGNSNEM
jgi:tRNA/rRNA methyltransferase